MMVTLLIAAPIVLFVLLFIASLCRAASQTRRIVTRFRLCQCRFTYHEGHEQALCPICMDGWEETWAP